MSNARLSFTFANRVLRRSSTTANPQPQLARACSTGHDVFVTHSQETALTTISTEPGDDTRTTRISAQE